MNNILSDFSPWVQWANRNNELELNSQGVYILKRFEQNVIPTYISLEEPLLYIGETCRNFGTRFRQFQFSATTGEGNHSGGCNFHANYNLDEIPAWLYLVILPINIAQPERSAYIRYLERYLIWNYVRFHNALPLCNSM